jgi:hypothetical protein
LVVSDFGAVVITRMPDGRTRRRHKGTIRMAHERELHLFRNLPPGVKVHLGSELTYQQLHDAEEQRLQEEDRKWRRREQQQLDRKNLPRTQGQIQEDRELRQQRKSERKRRLRDQSQNLAPRTRAQKRQRTELQADEYSDSDSSSGSDSSDDSNSNDDQEPPTKTERRVTFQRDSLHSDNSDE